MTSPTFPPRGLHFFSLATPRSLLAVVLLLGLAWCGRVDGATRTWTGSAGDGRWATAANWSGNAVPGDQDDAVIPPGTVGVVEVDGTANVRSVKNSGTVHLAGVFAGNATLSVSADSENSGLIQLGSTRSDRGSTLQSTGGARWINKPAGRIESALENGGGRRFIGSLSNQGLVTATATGLQASGSVEVAGGRFDGAVAFLNCEVKVTASPAQPTEVLLYGDSSRLVSDNLQRVVLRVLSDFDYNAVLNVPSNSVNHGTIRLESSRNDRTTRLTIAPSVVLSNAVDGVIETDALGGGRQASGPISNSGLIHVQSGQSLRILNSGTKFAQLAGTLQGEGAITVVGGRFDFLGGDLQGVVFAENAEIQAAASVTTASELFLRGHLSTLVGVASPAVTLHLLADFDFNAILTALPGAVNGGRIILDSSRGDRYARLDSAAGCTNAPTGVVEIVTGGGGGREMVGRFVNRGLVTAAGEAAVTVTGDWEVAGGRNQGAVNLVNAGIRVTQSPPESNTLMLYGSNSRLLTDNLANVTLRAISDVGYNAALIVPASVVNHGTIQLSSPRNDRTTTLEVAEGATLENAADGTIEFTTDGGGAREFRRSLVNRGRVQVEPGITLLHRNTGKTLVQHSGVFDVGGAYTLEGGQLDFKGGSFAGTFTGLNVEFQVAPTATTPSTVFVLGEGSTLVAFAPPR